VAEIQKEAEVLKGAGTGSKKKTSRVSVVGRVGVAVGVGAAILAAAAYFTGLVGGHPKLEGEPASAKVESKAGPSDTVDLTEKQVASIKVEPVGERLFAVEKGAVGNIDYNQDMAVQVFTNYQGRINGLFAKVGDDVKKDQILFTIDSPDLLQAESTLIAADGVLLMTTRVLNRQKGSSPPKPRRRRMSTRRLPISKPPKVRCWPRAMPSQSSARRKPKSITSSPSARLTRRWLSRARSPDVSRPAAQRPGSSCSRAISQLPTSLPISRPSGCLPT